MSEFFEIARLKWGPVQYFLNTYKMPNFEDAVENYTLSMEGHQFPLSVRPTEFEFLKNLIIKHNLKSGFELATAFGVSTTALGLGFKETGGKLLTMDAYVEEREQFYQLTYQNTEINNDSDGFKSVNYLIEHFRLQEVVYPTVGWSPRDIIHSIKKFPNNNFDFVFLDGGHSPQQIMADLMAIYPLLGQKYIFVLHDYFENVYTEEVKNLIIYLFGELPKVELPQPFGENLAIIYKNFDK